jgi:serine/threonine protein kinase
MGPQLTDELDVRLADWGMSLPIVADRLPTEGLGLGTTLYCAPELVQAPPCAFSFPADIFALGVTLNVLVTGREPYRDVRSPVEQMLWVGRGAYWSYEERHRLGAIGHRSTSGSVHSGLGTSLSASSRPPSRVGSVRSLRSLAIDQATVSSSDPLADLSDLLGPAASPEALLKARAALANAAAGSGWELDDVPDLVDGASSSAAATTPAEAYARTYSDGSPLQYFLDGREPVPEGVRLLLKRMTSPEPADRPTAGEVLNALSVF